MARSKRDKSPSKKSASASSETVVVEGTEIDPTGLVAVQHADSGLKNCIFLSWDDAKGFLMSEDGLPEYKICASLKDAQKYLSPASVADDEEPRDEEEAQDKKPEASPAAAAASQYPMAPGYPYMYYPGQQAQAAAGGSTKKSGKRKASAAAPEDTKMGAYQYGAGYGVGGYGGYPYYYGGGATAQSYPPVAGGGSTSKKTPGSTNKKAKTTASAVDMSRRHRPPLPPMAYNGWNSSPEYKILVEYYHMVGTTKLLFQPTLQGICQLNGTTQDAVLNWMKTQRTDFYTMPVEQRSRTATFDLLAKIDFPFGTAENYSLDTSRIMVASKVQRRKVPFLGILKASPTKAELQEGVAAQRQGPVWDCMYLALSDYVKISGTLQVIEPTYMTVILRQFAKGGSESILTMDHLLTWMTTQRNSYRETTMMTNQREMTKATSKLSCLQTVGFDWEYEPRVVDAVLTLAKANAAEGTDVEKAVKKSIEDFIFDDGDNFLVRTDQGSYYKPMKEIPNDPNAGGNMPPTRSSHLPDKVEKAILRTMLPPQNQLQFSHICNLNLELFGFPEDKLRKACTNRRKYLEKVEVNNPPTFKRLLKQQGLPDGKDYDVGGGVPDKEIEILLKGYAQRKKEDPAKVEEAILRSMLPPQDKLPFAEIIARRETIFGPPNGRVVRAAKKRRKELDEIKRLRTSEFDELLKKKGLDKLKEADNGFPTESATNGNDGAASDEDDGNLFWNKPGSNILADKETQKKYRMQRNPLPLETDKLLCKHVLGGDHRFALLCNSRPSLFGLPNSRERRKIDDRRRLLREMMQKRPAQFVEVCRAHDLDDEVKKQGLVKPDGSINEEMSKKLAAGKSSGDGDGEDKSPTKDAANALQALRRKGSASKKYPGEAEV